MRQATGLPKIINATVPSLRACYVICRAIEVQNELEEARNSQLFRTNPQRYLALRFVKAFNIDVAAPFNIGEHPAVRDFLSLMRKNFDVSALNNKGVSWKHQMVM